MCAWEDRVCSSPVCIDLTCHSCQKSWVAGAVHVGYVRHQGSSYFTMLHLRISSCALLHLLRLYLADDIDQTCMHSLAALACSTEVISSSEALSPHAIPFAIPFQIRLLPSCAQTVARDARGTSDNGLELWADAPRFEYSDAPLMVPETGAPLDPPTPGTRGHSLLLSDTQVCVRWW